MAAVPVYTQAPIHIAATTRDDETLRRLLAEGVSPDLAGGDFGSTPLHCLCAINNAAAGDRVACFKLLRDAGANLDATNNVGNTPLTYAVLSGDATIVSLLVEAGANIDAADSHGLTALHFAAGKKARKYVDCIEVLLAAGASVNVRNASGRTPFGTILAGDHRRMFALFLRAGAEIPINETHPYILRVRNAGGWKKYEQAHLARITAILAPTPRLPPEMVRKIVEFWLHAGFY